MIATFYFLVNLHVFSRQFCYLCLSLSCDYFIWGLPSDKPWKNNDHLCNAPSTPLSPTVGRQDFTRHLRKKESPMAHAYRTRIHFPRTYFSLIFVQFIIRASYKWMPRVSTGERVVLFWLVECFLYIRPFEEMNSWCVGGNRIQIRFLQVITTYYYLNQRWDIIGTLPHVI